jgi:hypothetical protein
VTTNIAASVRARLANQAKASHRPFQEVLQHFGLERLLYRLAQSPHRSRFLLKGALLLNAWNAPVSRPTRDIDLLGYAENDVAVMEAIFREICTVTVVDDGLRFDATTLVGRRIKEDADYQGVRLTFVAFLEKARIPMQIDIGFGDVVTPSAEDRSYPTLLDLPAPHLRMYPRETVIAEKFEAMVQLGTLNTRMKDFFDIWLLASQFNFTGPELAQAVEKTFTHRGTRLDADPVALTPSFMAAENTQKQWAAFVKRSQLDNAPKTLDDARAQLRSFLLPVASAVLAAQSFADSWSAPGPWRTP